MSAVGSSELSRWATANTSLSPFSAASMARNVEGLPAAIGWVRPGKITVPRRGRTGSVWRCDIVIPHAKVLFNYYSRTSPYCIFCSRGFTPARHELQHQTCGFDAAPCQYDLKTSSGHM